MTGQRLDPEEVIRDWLSDSAPDRVPASLRETLEDVTSRPAGHARPSPRFARRHLLMAGRLAAALAILTIVASGAYLYGNSRTASPSPVVSFASTSPSAQPSGSPSASPSANPSLQSTVTQLPGSSWRLVSGALPQMVASSWGSFESPIFSLPGSGFLAFVPSAGSVTHVSVDAILAAFKTAGPTAPTSWTTRVFQSTDGVSWTERSILPSVAATVTSVAEANGQIVAVGWTTSGPDVSPTAWTSADLQTWRATALPAPKDALGTTAYGVAAGPAGFLSWGYASTGTEFWISTDGATWRSLATAGLPADSGPDALFSLPDGYAIRGFLTDRAAVWRSNDGQHWTQTWTGPAMSGMEGYALGPVVRAPDGSYISFGGAWMAPGGMTATPQDLLIWTGRDGATWTLSDRIRRPGWTDGFAALPGGYVGAGVQALGDPGTLPLGTLAVWTSRDGRIWQPVPGIPQVPSIEVLSVVSDGARAIVTFVDQAGDIQLLVGDGLQ